MVVDEVEVASSGVELRRGDREDVEVVDFELDRAELVTHLPMLCTERKTTASTSEKLFGVLWT